MQSSPVISDINKQHLISLWNYLTGKPFLELSSGTFLRHPFFQSFKRTARPNGELPMAPEKTSPTATLSISAVRALESTTGASQRENETNHKSESKYQSFLKDHDIAVLDIILKKEQMDHIPSEISFVLFFDPPFVCLTSQPSCWPPPKYA